MQMSIVEVGPRDGLQNEAALVPVAEKIAFVDRLAAAGHSRIEVSAFVSPKWIPQLADAVDVFGGITPQPGVRYSALVPNAKGLERAITSGVTDIAIFAAASETFSRKNINQSIDESFAGYADVMAEATTAGMRVRGYLSTCFGCPFEGNVPPARVAELTTRLLDLGVYEVAISDTIGVAHPGQVKALLSLLTSQFRASQLALHFHDTRGTALANVLAALDFDITTFDSSAGGLGGCPYAPGASGNLATEDLVYMLHGLGLATGIDLDRLTDASLALEPSLTHRLPSRYVNAVRSRRRTRP
ncbi:MAG: hydroxymethylglutaryl-CoA lyase [Acidobacteriota bacterium]